MAKFDQLHLTGPKYTEWMLIAEYFHFYHLARLRKWEMRQTIHAILFVIRRLIGPARDKKVQ